jgi:hypothetical protein
MNMAVERDGIELGKDGDLIDVSAKTIAHRDINEPVFTRKRYGRLCSISCQWIQSRTSTTPHDHGQHVNHLH